LVLDGDSLAHRSYHALPRSIRDRDGRPANMIVGFADTLAALWEAERPRAALACWDTVGIPTWRHALLAGYQGGRDFADDLVEQLGRLPTVVAALGLANAKGEGWEADDFLAAAVADERDRRGRAVVVTSDRDAWQLVGPDVTVVRPLRGASVVERIGPAEVVARYGVGPEHVPDFIALRGDPSDRIPGARGIGPARAARLLAAHGTLEGVLAAGAVADAPDALRLYRHVATMRADAPVPDVPDAVPDWVAGARLLSGWGLDGVAGRLGARGG
jgi:DNA polymerase-1